MKRSSRMVTTLACSAAGALIGVAGFEVVWQYYDVIASRVASDDIHDNLRTAVLIWGAAVGAGSGVTIAAACRSRRLVAIVLLNAVCVLAAVAVAPLRWKRRVTISFGIHGIGAGAYSTRQTRNQRRVLVSSRESPS